MANLQLSLIRPQIELLSPKQNGTIEMDRNAPSKATNKATIKSMWKKAFKSLKTKEAPMSDKADGGEQSAGTHRKSSRQSSFRKSLLRRKDSKERESDQETNDDHEVDPVYSLLKCAADLPRQHKLGHGHACCMRVQAQNENTPSGRQETCVGSGRNNSRSSSPSSEVLVDCEDLPDDSFCSCPCHKPELLKNYNEPLFQPIGKKKLKPLNLPLPL